MFPIITLFLVTLLEKHVLSILVNGMSSVIHCDKSSNIVSEWMGLLKRFSFAFNKTEPYFVFNLMYYTSISDVPYAFSCV